MEVPERNRFAYYKKKRGGFIKKADRQRGELEVISPIDTIWLEITDANDNRYMLQAGNGKKILHQHFYPATPEGLQEAEAKFNEYYEANFSVSPDKWYLNLRIYKDNLEREYARIGRKDLALKRKQLRLGLIPNAKTEEKRKNKRQDKLRGEISDMIMKNQIDLKAINKIYDEELRRIEEKNQKPK